MDQERIPNPHLDDSVLGPKTDAAITQLVTEIYAAAPMSERGRLLDLLLRPHGLLPLVVIAGGIFAKIRFRSGTQGFNVRIEDIEGVRALDVMELVEYTQVVSMGTIENLATTLSTSPLITCTAAAGLLAGLLAERIRAKRSS